MRRISGTHKAIARRTFCASSGGGWPFSGSKDGPRREVPISIVARDPAVLDRVADWGWTDGLKPAPQAPVWRVDSVRDRFLTTFGSAPGGKVSAQPR